MSDLPAFDEIHVISDIHMGGKPGFQILRETTRLANFIRRVGREKPDAEVALILNGDVFDTLAEDVSGYVAVDDAVATVTRIMNDPSFAAIWEGLGEFVRAARRTLVFVIGNHDIEIAFPPVQRLIRSRLAGEDRAARARIEFSAGGAGYACAVGQARVFCIHGNEVDAWNYNRYEDLARVARRLNAGRSLDPSEWRPNAGTKMVKEVMNDVKRKYAWIDLLKPETAAAVGTLLVLDPSQLAKINRLPGIVGERTTGKFEVNQRLSVEGFHTPEPGSTPALSVDQLLGPHVKDGIRIGASGVTHDADTMLLDAERSFATGGGMPRSPDQTLGAPQLLWDRLTGWLTGVGADEALRRALKDWLEGDKTFDIHDRDDTFTQVTANVGSAVDFIVTGHTHLERAIDMGGGRHYFNCGTWIRLLRLSDAVLADTTAFRPVYDVLMNGRLDAIDSANFGGAAFVMDQTSAVSIANDGARVVGRLTHVEGNGTGAPRVIEALSRP